MTKEQQAQAQKMIDIGMAADMNEAMAILMEDDLDIQTEQTKAVEEAARMRNKAEKGKASVKRERKPNFDKQEIIQTIEEALSELGENVTVSNKERQVDFELNGVKYSVTLTAHREKKG